MEWAARERRETEPEDCAQVAVGRRVDDAFVEAANGFVDEQQDESILNAVLVHPRRALDYERVRRSLRLWHDATERPRHPQRLRPDVKTATRFAAGLAAGDQVRHE